jgi:hypothetical protein
MLARVVYNQNNSNVMLLTVKKIVRISVAPSNRTINKN